MQIINYYRQLTLTVSCYTSFCFAILLLLSSNVLATETVLTKKSTAEVEVAAKRNSPLWQDVEKR